MSILQAALLGMLAGVAGTGVGGALAFVFKKISMRLLGGLMCFSGGIMISVVCFDLLPDAFAMHSLGMGLFGLALGVIFILAVEAYTAHQVPGEGLLRTGILLVIGIAAHNFPEGLAIGSGSVKSAQLGIGLCLLIALHDVPEGLAMGLPLSQSGVRLWKVLGYALLAGAPSGVGALMGAAAAASGALISLSLGLASGAMLYITCGEILPQSYSLHRGRFNGVALIAGVMLGMAACALLG